MGVFKFSWHAHKEIFLLKFYNLKNMTKPTRYASFYFISKQLLQSIVHGTIIFWRLSRATYSRVKTAVYQLYDVVLWKTRWSNLAQHVNLSICRQD